MKAVVITEAHTISVVEREVPAIGADEVLVKPSSCGICGTDVHILRHGFIGTRYPVTPGHEFVGHIVAVGPEVRGLKEGDYVCVDPNVVCGTCRWCEAGRPNLCPNLTPIGAARPGAAAEYVAAPARNTYLVKKSIGDGPAAMIEPLACALHAVESSNGVKDRNVLVIGGGTMGMLIALSVKARGAGSVTISEPSATKRDIARAAGIEDARAPDAFDDTCFDVVFEAAGVPAALEQGIGLLEKTGTLVQVGVHEADKTASFNPFLLYEREQTFVGSNSCADQFGPAVDFIDDIKDEVSLLIGNSFDVWDFEAAIADMESGKSIKTLVHFR